MSRNRAICVICGATAGHGPVEPILVDMRRDDFGEVVSLCVPHEHLIRRPA